MALTICHTGDWHLGHTLYRRGREHEHARFLAWLVDQLEARGADALVVAGDVFDSGSPPGSALAMFYGFLADARRRMPALSVIVVAGNHDSPARLAAPDPVLRELGVSIVGSVAYEKGELAPARMVVPIERDGRVVGRVAAVPFLRGADLPAAAEAGTPEAHALGARRVYDAVLAHARSQGDAPLIVTGHFAAAGARMSRESERLLAIGIDGTLPIDVIDTDGVAYVALGHLHLAQQVPARTEARYAGSPIPLSFAERALDHEVRFVTIDDGVTTSEPVRVPRTVQLVRLPEAGLLDRSEVVSLLETFPLRGGEPNAWPWIEVRAQVTHGERDALERIEAAAAERAIHLVHVVLDRPAVEDAMKNEAARTASLDPTDVLTARWLAEHGASPPDEVLDALAEALGEARGRIEQRRQRGVEMEAERVLTRAPAIAARRVDVLCGEGGE